MTAPSPQAVPVDGRTARRDRNREAVLDAVIALFGEDAMFPAPAQVAERSGVSRRSVQRYFADSEALARAAMDRQLDQARVLFEVEGLGEGPVEDRVARLVASRITAYEAIAPVMRAALVRSRSTPLVREQMEPARRNLLLQVWVMFEPEMEGRALQERRELVSAVDLLLAFEAVEHLLHDRGLSVLAVRRTLERGTLAILRAPIADPTGH